MLREEINSIVILHFSPRYLAVNVELLTIWVCCEDRLLRSY